MSSEKRDEATFRAVCARLLLVADLAAPRIRNISDPAVIEAILQEEIARALSDLRATYSFDAGVLNG